MEKINVYVLLSLISTSICVASEFVGERNYTLKSILNPFILNGISANDDKDVSSGVYTSILDALHYKTNENDNGVIDKYIQQVIEMMSLRTAKNHSKPTACQNDMRMYLNGLRNGRNWALKMFDSSAKIPDGVLMGNLMVMGNFDECIGIHSVKSEFGDFKGQYCMVHVQVNIESLLEYISGFLQPQSHIESIRFPFEYEYAKLAWGVCVPSSCAASDLEQFLPQTALQNNDATLRATVPENSCTTSERSSFRPVDWVAVGVFGFFGILVIMSTVYSMIAKEKAKHHPLLLAFSIPTNVKKLLKVESTAGTLSAVHGIRLLSMMWVLLGHSVLFNIRTPSVNSISLIQFVSSWSHSILTNATLSVDSFFLMSGLLTCYCLFGLLEKGKPYNVPLSFLARYIRLTPPYAAMMLFTATLLNYTGDGPLWRTVMDESRIACEVNWWTNLLFINNFVNNAQTCLGQSWYLSVDMQLFWISPLILHPLWRWPKYGKIFLYVLSLIGIVIGFTFPYVYEMSMNVFITALDQAKYDFYFQYIYFPTYLRFVPWLIGIWLGYVLHYSKNKNVHLKPFEVFIGWLISFLITSILVYGVHYIQQPDYEYNRLYESLFQSIMRPAWAIVLAWVIFACVKGYGGWVNTFLSWRMFQVFGRLSYSVYLTHYSLLMWIRATVNTPIYLTDGPLVIQYLGEVIVCFTAGLVLSLIFESPLITVGGYFLNRNVSRKGENANGLKISEVIRENNLGITERYKFTLPSNNEPSSGTQSDELNGTSRDDDGYYTVNLTAKEINETVVLFAK